MPSADVSCRVAWSEDARAIAAVQVRAWRTSYADLLPADLLASMDVDQLATGWEQRLARPADARHRVMVALERNLVTGFVLTAPTADPDSDPVADGELSDLTVDPARRGQGHGSRLLQAGVETLVADRFARALTWLPATDEVMRAFHVEAGWGPDGAHRTLDLTGDGSVTLTQVRLHTQIA